LAVSGFAIDYGQFWVARRQAQNVADAAAHAGAVARGFDDKSPNPGGKVQDSVLNVVQNNKIWGVVTPPSATVISYEACPPRTPGPYPFMGVCVKVDIHRDGTLGSEALPTYFLKLAGISSQPVRATATAYVSPANATPCLKPWLVPDKWMDLDGNHDFNLPELYTPPGFILPDIGRQFEIRPGDGDAVTLEDDGTIVRAEYYIVGGSDDEDEATYGNHIVSCSLTTWLGKKMTEVDVTGTEETDARVQQLIDLDPDAEWDAANQVVSGPLGFGSPRVVILGLFNPKLQWEAIRDGRVSDLQVENLIGFFIEDVDDGVITGRVIARAADLKEDAPPPPREAGFLNAIHLVR
jgi:hypothetical protein